MSWGMPGPEVPISIQEEYANAIEELERQKKRAAADAKQHNLLYDERTINEDYYVQYWQKRVDYYRDYIRQIRDAW